jgi:hypothetical protein
VFITDMSVINTTTTTNASSGCPTFTVNVGHWEPPGHVYSKWVPELPLVGPPGLAS